jgi:dynein light intermediate chain 1, cytosolic
VVGRVGFWVLEGVEEYSDLLRFALTRETWATSLVVVALDFSKPWTLEASARKWLQVLQRAWDALALSPGERDELQERGADPCTCP